ncbi:MAG: DNA-directed RNA polymerase subunit beta' [Candidatus Abyssobacteria bacterium SURF_5]|uniref:DNA-directed RNA polymerase subunit beta' n=1 Tax=Abyssobacteria bacterium (strain SURF_5) TaxID=2093360 RepID=A0A3A4P9Q2_ABYX5|nr:MAG: DNA-directed RNA polymerase subunit beta' [Candidatus Abyssubacteria bacterium SURF_5]
MIKVASPETIRKWSRGEVKKPETINYRTFKPEKDGLFCEKIFGPVKDWECSCGKYKKVKHRGITCDRCGVEVTEARVRRERMGHITLASPVSHIWFFKTTPSCIGNMLDLSVRSLEKVLYFEEYIVIDPGKTPLKKMQTLSEDAYRKAREEFGYDFEAKMGAEAIKQLLEEIDIDKLTKELHAEFKESNSKQKKKKINKRLRIAEAIRQSGNKPSHMILDVVPVIPPDLRPLVPLEGGRYATSDLNDLYRRVINRNNRLKRLIELKAPDVIVRNEKRMLQEAVDALFDNGRHGRTVLGAGNRPLKSLSDMLKGKQGRFRQNLLGKRVDYSGRSVIVVGPELKLHQCGLPKKMALELFEPFIMQKLRERNLATTIKAAKKTIAQAKHEVWDILEDVIREHPVLLNRAPTLHRLGIQAFEPVLIEGKAIRIHPLVCAAFNADFDGDQMAVHVPLSPEAQLEARVLMLSSNNIFSPASGRPVVTPSQDMVLGISYLTKERQGAKGEGRRFRDKDEVLLALDNGIVDLHARIFLRSNGALLETTAGRVLFNDGLPKELQFVNTELSKEDLGRLIGDCYERLGHDKTVEVLDRLKEIGFRESTNAGISIAVNDLVIPKDKKELVAQTEKLVDEIDSQYQRGLITGGERYNKIIDAWTHCTEKVADKMFEELKTDKNGFNGIYLMASSGARGSKQQIRQLAGMRGLMAKPSGEIIENPIRSNFREGLSVLEYFISTHGARKGLADTALKTADAGYLTRRLVDVAQDVIINEIDCGTLNGIAVQAMLESKEQVERYKERIIGRVALDDIMDPKSKEVLVEAGKEIDEKDADEIETRGIDNLRIRSVLTCESERGLCVRCYGRNLATGQLVEQGEAVGIIAAQSIGEPGTQLTMRTFHIGGTASTQVEESTIRVLNSGIVQYVGLRTVKNVKGETVVAGRGGDIIIVGENDRELERFAVPAGAVVKVEEKQRIKKGELLAVWDPYIRSIVTETSGKVKYEDIIEALTMHEELDLVTGSRNRIIIEHKEDKHPQISIVDAEHPEKVLDFYTVPVGAHITVDDGQQVFAGEVLAKTPRKFSKTKDITGGLPRVAELFEARKPKDPAIISEIDGIIELGGYQKGLRKIKIVPKTGKEREYLIPHGKHLNVHTGDRVVAGQQLIDGPVVPQDILRVSGEKRLQEYLLSEIQEVYRLQGVRINDKHIEIMIRQMLKKVKIENPGDTNFLTNQQVDKTKFQEENDHVIREGGEPASAKPILLGITKASLGTDSFIAAAAFQQTTRVLTEAAISGRIDELRGLKENVIIGHLVPAGTGSKFYKDLTIDFEQPVIAVPVPEQPPLVPAGDGEAQAETSEQVEQD